MELMDRQLLWLQTESYYPWLQTEQFTFCDKQTRTNMVTDGILLTLVTDGTNGQTTNMVTDGILLPLVTDGTIYFL